MIAIIISSIILVGIFCYCRVKANEEISLLTKTCASLSFILLAVWCLLNNNSFLHFYHISILLGLIFGMVGDMLLDIKVSRNSDTMLHSGMTSFAIGHFCYIASILSLLNTKFLALSNLSIVLLIIIPIVFTIATALISFKMKLDFKTKFGFIYAMFYLLLLVFTATLSVSVTIEFNKILSCSIGLILFLLSDLILSQMYYGKMKDSVIMHVLNHITYYGGQILIAITLLSI